MAVISREFALQFEPADPNGVTGEIRLEASLRNLAAEILEVQGESPGCTLEVRYYMQIGSVAEQCPRIEQVVQKIWQPDTPPVQTLSFGYGQPETTYTNVIELKFYRKINEDQMEDLPHLIDHVLQTLLELGK